MMRSLSSRAPAAIDHATLVLFSAGETLVGAPVESVERILRVGTVRPLANPHPHVVGVVEHADRLVPVLRLIGRLAEDDAHIVRAADEEARLVVLARGTVWFAVQVDAVHDVVAVDATRIQRCAAAPGTPAVSHVLGDLRLDERLVRVLNVARLLTAPEWQAVAADHAALL